MNYTIQVDQQALGFIRHLIAQRPYAEVAGLIAQLDAQQNTQDAAMAIPIEQLKFTIESSI